MTLYQQEVKHPGLAGLGTRCNHNVQYCNSTLLWVSGLSGGLAGHGRAMCVGIMMS